MAYVNPIIALGCANRAEVFKRVRDALCSGNGTGNYSYDYSSTGMGWTWYDAYYATDKDTISTNDWFVLYSPGESGNDDLYFQFTYKANYIKVNGWLSFNASTDTGTQTYNSTDNWNITDAAVPVLWLYGDKDAIFGISRTNSGSADFMPISFGMTTNTLYPQTVVTCASSLSSGSGVSIAVTVPADWYAGKKIFIRDTANIARITIISIPDSGHITADLATNYLAGCKLSSDLGYYCTGGSYFVSTMYFLIGHDGTKNCGAGTWANASAIESYGHPEVMNSEHVVTPWFSLSSTYGILGQLKNVYQRYSSGMTALNVYDIGGVNYRAFTVYSAAYIVVKEV
jgi:hypothetical protein